MEEVQCALLGFGSISLPSSAPPLSSRTTQASPLSPPLGASGGISAALREQLHPTEYAQIMNTLPLGTLYVSLRSFSNDGAAGRLDGYIVTSTAMAVAAILRDYEAAVDAVQGIADLDALSSTFGEAFHALVRLTHHRHELPVFLLLVQQLTSSLDLPLSIRAVIGEHVSTTVLFCVAHFVAHGVVLEGRQDDFFIQKLARRRRRRHQDNDEDQQNDNGSSDDESDHRASSSSLSRFGVLKRLIPCGMQIELVHTMIHAGNTRDVLRKQLRRYGGATRLRSGEDDDATAASIFSSLYNAALTRGGRLVVEELAVRVEAARSIWSRALWELVGGGTKHLVNTARLLRDAFLGHRGDLWGTFVEMSLPVLANVAFLGASSSATSSSSSTKGMAVQIDRAYQSALRAVKLDDTALAHSVSLSMDIPAPVTPSNIHEVAEVVRSRIHGIFLTVDLSAGTELVIAKHTLDRYHGLFCFQLGIRFAMHALHTSRKQLQELVLSPFSSITGGSGSRSTSDVAGPSASASAAAATSWKHAMNRIAALLHFYTFVLSTVGQYFQVDVIEGHYSPLVHQLAASAGQSSAISGDRNRRRASRVLPTASAAPHSSILSVEDARIAHERALLSVSDAMFYLDASNDDGDVDGDHGGLTETLQSATHTALTLFCLVRRLMNSTPELTSSRGGGLRPLTSEVLTAIASLERTRNELIIGIASQLSKSSKPSERSLWARLDFNKFISTAWHNILRGGGPTRSTAVPSSQVSTGGGMPLSLAALSASTHRSGGGSAPGTPTTAAAVTTTMTTKLQSVALSRSSVAASHSAIETDAARVPNRVDF